MEPLFVPETTLQILRGWSLTADEELFVGDSEPDMQTAKAAGLKAIGCEWGFCSAEVLTEVGADVVIVDPRQIMELL